jgi:pseudaminic acid cytidylyltransferase
VSKTILVIPARGGSKRIPRKNVRLFCDKPMIAWPLLAARESGLFDHIIVSTDDEEIAETAIRYGAEAPFRRPRELADDHTPTLPVIAHAINWFEAHCGPVDLVCCLYATSPFIKPEFLREGLKTLKSHADAEFAFSVTTFAYPIFRSLKLGEDGTLAMFWPEHELSRSQDLPEAWHDAGQFYWGWKKPFLSYPSVMSGRSYPVPLPRSAVHDIDTKEDWEEAELVFQTLQNQKTKDDGN